MPYARPRAMAGICAVFTVLIAVNTLAWRVRYPDLPGYHDGIDGPVLALELARNAGDLREVFQTENPKSALAGKESANAYRAVSALKSDTVLDCFFIPCYSLFLLTMLNLFSSDVEKSRIRVAGGILVLAVAMLDYAENTGIFSALQTDSLVDKMAHAIRYPSLGKWALLGVVLSILGGVMILSRTEVFWSWARELLGVIYVITGLGLVAAITSPRWIASVNIGFALLVLVSAIGLLSPFFQVRSRPV